MRALALSNRFPTFLISDDVTFSCMRAIVLGNFQRQDAQIIPGSSAAYQTNKQIFVKHTNILIFSLCPDSHFAPRKFKN